MTTLLLTDDELDTWCSWLEIDPVTFVALAADRSRLADPTIRDLVGQVQSRLRDYRPGPDVQLPEDDDVPLLHAHAVLGLVPEVVRRQAGAGIDPDVTRATLWDVGNQLALHVRIHGRPGLEKASWLSHHLADHLFALGRLQFQRAWFPWDGAPIAIGEPHVDVHVPEGGRLDPSACDDSFARASAFLARHFSDHGAKWFTMSSWLLDPVLADLLGPEANITRFQQRFEVVHVDHEHSSRALEFVFHRPDLDEDPDPDQLAALPRRSSLERALVDLYLQGGRIRGAYGLAPIER